MKDSVHIWEEKNLTEPQKKLESKIESEATDFTYLIGKEFAMNEWKNIINQKISGIYLIINKVNGKWYVGSSKDIFKRWRFHINALKRKRHDNPHLQHSWNANTEKMFGFKIVECIPPIKSILLEVEQKYLNAARSDIKNTYNINFKATGFEHTSETKKKISKKLKGIKRSEETKLKMSESKTGISIKLTKKRNGHPLSELHKQHISDSLKGKSKESMKGRKWSNQHREKMEKIFNTIEHKEKMRNYMLGKKLDKGVIEKISNANRGKKRSEEFCKKMSDIAFKRYTTLPKYKFKNKYTNEEFEGTAPEFYKKYNLSNANVHKMIQGKPHYKSVKGWYLKIMD